MDIEKYVASDLLNKFEFYNYGHALEILHHAFQKNGRSCRSACVN